MKRVLTYGTFDLLHYGHINLLRRAKALGDYLVVAVSTDDFNEIKGKKAYHNYETRKMMLEAVRSAASQGSGVKSVTLTLSIITSCFPDTSFPI